MTCSKHSGFDRIPAILVIPGAFRSKCILPCRVVLPVYAV